MVSSILEDGGHERKTSTEPSDQTEDSPIVREKGGCGTKNSKIRLMKRLYNKMDSLKIWFRTEHNI